MFLPGLMIEYLVIGVTGLIWLLPLFGVNAVDSVRRKYLKKLSQLTGRPVIAYYSGWLSNPGAPGIEVNDEDKNAFMMAIHKVEKE